MANLWGEDFEIPKKDTPKKIKQVVTKATKPIEAKVVTEKVIKSKQVPLLQKLALIKENVYKILGKYADNTVVIKTREQLHQYIDACLINGEMAYDTETNNSLDPISCKIMGPCLYTYGQKQAYVPINHIDPITRERLDWQLTEQDLYEELERLNSCQCVVMHNGKFDYEVTHCTCGVDLRLDWDTLLGSFILDENEPHKLKEQYVLKIDSNDSKYDIENLFEKLEYAVVDPEVFALYAATDAFKTLKLKEYQKKQFEKPENSGLYDLFLNLEVPVSTVTAKMELSGVSLDINFASRLSNKYHRQCSLIDQKIDLELHKYDDIIKQWRQTPDAQFKPTKLNSKGVTCEQKSKSEQLSDPVSVTSPTQLAILFYDILKVGIIDKKTPRGTGEEILQTLSKSIPLCKLILEKRGVEKLISTYIDKLPQCLSKIDNRIHPKYNQAGAKTGRYSSNEPNLQNIPSHEKAIRMLFVPKTDYKDVEISATDNCYYVAKISDVYTQDQGWVNVKHLQIGQYIQCSDDTQWEQIINLVDFDSQNVLIYV